MPKLDVTLAPQEIEKDGEYKIIDVSEYESPKGDKGLRIKLVALDETDKKDYSTILWMRDLKNIGKNSKLGAFINALTEINPNTGQPKQGVNTDKWQGINIRVVSWEERNREIQVIA